MKCTRQSDILSVFRCLGLGRCLEACSPSVGLVSKCPCLGLCLIFCCLVNISAQSYLSYIQSSRGH